MNEIEILRNLAVVVRRLLLSQPIDEDFAVHLAAVRSASFRAQKVIGTADCEYFDLNGYLGRQIEFSESTFGPGQRTAGVLDHIRKELMEIEADPDDLEEWIDVVMLAFDGAWRAGYGLAPHVIDAADHGVPQHRVRLFIVASRSRAPVRLVLERRPHVGAGRIIRWAAHRWSAIDKPGRSPKTLARVMNGRRQFGERFVMPYYGSGSGLTGRSLARPLGTVTTRDRWAVVDGARMRMWQPDEYKAAMSFPDSYQLPRARHEAIHMLGNAVCPVVACDLIRAVAAA